MTEPLAEQPKILIVDDVDEIREVLVLMLKKDGFETFQASNGREAYDLLKNQSIEFLVTDLMMPDMNGMELIKQVKSEYPEIEILAITGNAVNSDIQDALDQGASICIRKPFSREHLLEKIHDLNLRRQRFRARQVSQGDRDLNVTPERSVKSRNVVVMLILILVAIAIAVYLGTQVFKEGGSAPEELPQPFDPFSGR